MKSLLFNLFAVTLLLCLCLQYGSGLSCYECNDRVPTTPCKNMTSKMIKDCGNNDPICTAEWAHDTSSGRNVTYIRRACANVTMTGRSKVFFKSTQTTVMYCNTELCNAAVGVSSSIVMFFLSAVISLFFFKDRY